ncbi:MAG: DUF559 domain-containing protein [Pirellulales bacterium]
MGSTEPDRLIIVEWDILPRGAALTDSLLDALAKAAADAWPAWYTIDDPENPEPDFESTMRRHKRASVDRRVPTDWLKRAVNACRMRLQPQYRKNTTAEIEAQQLALALGGGSCKVVLIVRRDEQPQGALFDLSRKAEWLASETGWPVLVLIPIRLGDSPELDAIRYDRIEFDESPLEGSVEVDAETKRRELARRGIAESPSRRIVPAESDLGHETTGAPNVFVHPLIGRPHPRSRGENSLWNALQADAELNGLFRCNQPIRTTLGSRFLADFHWLAGGIVVEVDGYYWHSSRFAFAMDRRRDYELQLSGLLVLRLPHDETLLDVNEVLERIRRCVRLRFNQRPELRAG